jgi:hypothetical protein
LKKGKKSVEKTVYDMSEEELYEHYNNIMKDNAKRVDPEVPINFLQYFQPYKFNRNIPNINKT